MDHILPSEARRLVLEDHDRLRARIAEIRALAERGEPGAMVARACELLRRLEEHMALEEERLLPVLALVDAWGPQRAARVRAEHRAQRRWIVVNDAWLKARPSPREASEQILRFLAELEADMELEERRDLGEDLLSDGGPGPDLGGGVD